MEDGEGEFDPLLDDEDDDEESAAGGNRRNSRAGVQGGYNLLYIGSLKVPTSVIMMKTNGMNLILSKIPAFRWQHCCWLGCLS